MRCFGRDFKPCEHCKHCHRCHSVERDQHIFTPALNDKARAEQQLGTKMVPRALQKDQLWGE